MILKRRPARELTDNRCQLRRSVRNTCLESTCRSLEAQGLSGTSIQAQRDLVERHGGDEGDGILFPRIGARGMLSLYLLEAAA